MTDSTKRDNAADKYVSGFYNKDETIWMRKTDFKAGYDAGVAERDEKEKCLHEGMRLLNEAANIYKARAEKAEAEVERLEHNLACLLSHATGGLLSKTNYSKDAMYEAVSEYIEYREDKLKDRAEKLAAALSEVIAFHGFDLLPEWVQTTVIDTMAEYRKGET
jgi:hypothetical protein